MSWILSQHILLEVWVREQVLIDSDGDLWLFQVLLFESSLFQKVNEFFRAVFDRKSLSHRVPAILLLPYEVLWSGEAIGSHTILFLFLLDDFIWLATEAEFVNQALEVSRIMQACELQAQHCLDQREAIELVADVGVVCLEVHV